MKALMIVLLMWVCLGACQDKPEVSTEPLLRSVRYVTVKGDSAGQQRTFSGIVRAGNTSRLSFQVGGRIEKVYVNVGDAVKKGAPIAKVDPTDAKIQLQEARAALADTRASAQSADASYDRVKALYERRNASRQDLDNARARRTSARAGQNAASQTVRRLQRQVGYTMLAAPGAGTISAVNVEANEMASAGQVIAQLQVGEELEVALEVPAAYINRIKSGDPITVAIDALGDIECTGRIYEIGTPASGGTLFPVTARLDDGKAANVRAGMAASVTMKFGGDDKAEPRHLVPLTAVGQDREGRFVFRIEMTGEELGTVHRVPVEVGAVDGERIEILSGIEDGQQLVTMGVRRIHEGLSVRVPGQGGATP